MELGKLRRSQLVRYQPRAAAAEYVLKPSGEQGVVCNDKRQREIPHEGRRCCAHFADAERIGGAVAFVPQIFASVKQGVILSVALAISAGVMLYVSFIEIFVKAQAEIEKSLGPSGAAATTTACFFAGMLFCVVLELLVHKCMGHGRAVRVCRLPEAGAPG